MKNSIYAALFVAVATAISAIPASATPSNDMLTTSGPPPAFRATKASQSTTQISGTTYVPKLKIDNTQARTSVTATPAATVPIVSGPPMWWRTNNSSQK